MQIWNLQDLEGNLSYSGTVTIPAEARGGRLCVAIIASISLGDLLFRRVLGKCDLGARGINVSPLLTGFRFPSHYVKMPV